MLHAIQSEVQLLDFMRMEARRQRQQRPRDLTAKIQ